MGQKTNTVKFDFNRNCNQELFVSYFDINKKVSCNLGYPKMPYPKKYEIEYYVIAFFEILLALGSKKTNHSSLNEY